MDGPGRKRASDDEMISVHADEVKAFFVCELAFYIG